jgi:hypothetical protein
MCAKYTLNEKPSIFIRDRPIFLSERMLHKDYYCKISVEKINFWSWASRGLPEDELIGGKPPKLLYDWRFTANQFVLAPGSLRTTTGDFIFK